MKEVFSTTILYIMNAPIIKPRESKTFESKQSKYDQVGKLPMRSVVLGPSGSGKTILLQNMILDIYRGCFERIYIMSPSIDVDTTWDPVKKYITKVMKVKHTDEEPIYFDHYDPVALDNILTTQHKLADNKVDELGFYNDTLLYRFAINAFLNIRVL